MKKLISYMLLLLFVSGCLDIKLEDQYSDPDAIKTTDNARELLASAYNSLPRYQMELSILADDFVPSEHTSKYAELQNLYNWEAKAIEELSDNVWNEYYMTIAIVNALLPRIENINPTDGADAVEKEIVRSEAKALKAMCYFDLLRLYGPKYSAENLSKDGIILKNRLELDFLPRSSVQDCVAEIDRLLSEAASVDNESEKVFYLSTPAVRALQAEFELYRGDYKAAISYGLPLLDDAESRWSKTEYESLWSDNASADRLFAPYIFNSFYRDLCFDREDGDYFVLNPTITYGDDDVRKDWASHVITMSGRQVATLGKYNRMYYDNLEVRYINTMRYSGVCFTVAEAYARDGEDALARKILNQLMNAYGAGALGENLEGDALIEEILRRKQEEFAGEGVRIFDLKRHGASLKKYTNYGASVSATIKSDDYRWLLPIPQSEYRYNDKITQNNPQWPFIKTE